MLDISVKWTQKMFEDFVKDNIGEEYTVVGDYVDNKTKIEIHHKKCGRNFDITPANFKTRKRCPLCNGTFRKTTKTFVEEMKKLRGEEYVMIGEYVNAKTKVNLLHTKCHRFWEVTPDDFLNGKNECLYCSNSYQDTKKFSEKVEKLSQGTVKVLGEYINKTTPIKFKHLECGREFYRQPQHFLSGCYCSHCGIENRSGKNHYKYNHKLTDEDREKRDMQSGQLKKWRNLVYVRDAHTCQVCRKTGDTLNAHHLNSWNTDKENRFNVDNGITLCINCHKNFHTFYGYGNNTKKQFKEFLKRI